MLLAVALSSSQAWVGLAQGSRGVQIKDIQKHTHPNNSASANPLAVQVPPYDKRLGYLWSSPFSSSSTHALGGGITWAMDDALCDQMMGSFGESLIGFRMSTCETMKAAIHRAFDSWAANSAKISFVDVTKECQQRLNRHDANCPLAEIWITWMTTRDSKPTGNSTNQASRDLLMTSSQLSVGDAPALRDEEVEVDESRQGTATSNTAALAQSYPRYTASFRFTNGQQPSGFFVEITRSTMSFNPGLCWYLDSTFCSGFHVSKQALGEASARLLFTTLAVCLFVVALLGIAFNICWALKKAGDTLASTRGDAEATSSFRKRQAWKRGMMAFAQQSTYIWLVWFTLLVFPLTFYFQVFLPCWECFDFEAAAAHEIGHILGLGHPDRADAKGGQNSYNDMLAQGQRWDAATCVNPWQTVKPGVPPMSYYPGAQCQAGGGMCYAADGKTELVDRDGVRPSIMKALTQHNPRVCLSEDDLEALNTLYPDCETAITLPVCFKTDHNIGWVRFFVWSVCPVVLMLLMLVCLNSYLRKFQLKRYASAISIANERGRALQEANRKAARLKKELANTSGKADQELSNFRGKIRNALGIRRTSLVRRSSVEAGEDSQAPGAWKHKIKQLLRGRRTSCTSEPSQGAGEDTSKGMKVRGKPACRPVSEGDPETTSAV